MTQKITKENFEKLTSNLIYARDIKERIQHDFSNALEASKDTEYEIEREGKMVKLKGDTLWYEVQNLGRECDAGKVLRQYFPTIFELSEDYDNLIKEITVFAKTEIGIDPMNISMIDIANFTEGVFNYKKAELTKKFIFIQIAFTLLSIIAFLLLK